MSLAEILEAARARRAEALRVHRPEDAAEPTSEPRRWRPSAADQAAIRAAAARIAGRPWTRLGLRPDVSSWREIEQSGIEAHEARTLRLGVLDRYNPRTPLAVLILQLEAGELAAIDTLEEATP